MSRKYYINKNNNELFFKLKLPYKLSKEDIVFIIAFSLDQKKPTTTAEVKEIISHFILNYGFEMVQFHDTNRINYNSTLAEKALEDAESILDSLYENNPLPDTHKTELFVYKEHLITSVITEHLCRYISQFESGESVESLMTQKQIMQLLKERTHRYGFLNMGFLSVGDLLDDLVQNKQSEVRKLAQSIVTKAFPRLNKEFYKSL